LPIFYFTEFMGLAFGYSEKELFLNKHFVSSAKLIEEQNNFRQQDAGREKA